MINVEILTQTCTLQSVLGGTHEERVKEWMNQQKYIIKSTIKMTLQKPVRFREWIGME